MLRDPGTLLLHSQEEGLWVWHSLADFKESADAVGCESQPVVHTDWASIILKIKFAPDPFGLASNGRGKALIYGKRILNK